jgi:hypothetical protein
VRAGAPVALTIRESSSLAARHFVLERALHRRLGRISGEVSISDPSSARFLAAAGMAHGWRAGLWEPLLPVSSGLPTRSELDAEASGRVQPLLGEIIGGLSGSGGGAVGPRDVVAMLVRDLYPELALHYEQIGSAVSPVSDGPLALAARRAAADLHRVTSDGMSLLELPDAERAAQMAATNILVRALISDLTPPLH